MSGPRGVNEAFACSVANELVRGGVTHACISPGSRSGPLALGLEREPQLTTHVHVDERSAAFLALGIARALGHPAAVLCTSGSAAANLHPAIVEARHSSTPMVVLTADRPPELRATGANQTVDQIKMFGDSVVWFSEAGVPDEAVTSPGFWRSLICRAITEAIARGGPVHLNLALREPLFPDPKTPLYPHATDGRTDGRPWTEVMRSVAEPSERAVGELVRELEGTERGVVIAGAVQTDLSPLLRMAAVAGWPVLAEPASNIRVPGTISCYDAMLRSEGFVNEHQADVVLRVGKLGLGRPLSRFLQNTRQISIGPPGTWWDEQRRIETVLIADPAVLCARVTAELGPRSETPWARSWRTHENTARRVIDEMLDSDDSPSEPRAARDLAVALPDGANLFASSSMPLRELDSFMVPRTGVKLHANRGANGIDGTVSTAFGIAAATRAPTAALLGDLALLHDSNGMLYPERDNLDVTFVVVNNDGGGIFSFLEQAGLPDFERIFGTPHGVDLRKFADLYGLPHTAIERAGDLVEVVGSASGSRLIEIRTDRQSNVEFHRAIWSAVDDALASTR